jgi:hypothetical protein
MTVGFVHEQQAKRLPQVSSNALALVDPTREKINDPLRCRDENTWSAPDLH